MAFNFENFARFTRAALFRSNGTHYRLTPKRVSRLVAFYILFPLAEILNWTGFLLDDVFFRRYRQAEVKQPVFIVGNPRSGTTFLQRLIARDTENFTCMRTWEILLAPSITQRKVVWALATLDRWLGSPLHKRLAELEKCWRERNVVHKVSLWAPEEDQYLFLHIWSTLAIWTFSGIVDEAGPYTFFDTQVPEVEKERVMDFYQRCMQRHLCAYGGDHSRSVHYLSKNPSASSKIDTLYRSFPDAKVIYLVRNPLDVIPSYISLLDYTWDIFGAVPDGHKSRDYVLDMARHWYSYPLERLKSAPQDSYVVVNFEDLVDDPERTVTGIYRRFGIEIGPSFARVLQEATERARNYSSRHEYSLGRVGLTREQIVAEYADVFERFGFDTRESAGQAATQAQRPWPGDIGYVTRRKKSRSDRNLRRGPRGLTRGEGQTCV